MGGSSYSKDWSNSHHITNSTSYTYIPTTKVKIHASKVRTVSSVDQHQTERLNSELKKLESDLSSIINRLDNILKIYKLHPEEKSRESGDGR